VATWQWTDVATGVKIDMWQHGSGLMWPQEVKIDMWQHGSGLMWPQEISILTPVATSVHCQLMALYYLYLYVMQFFNTGVKFYSLQSYSV
jgi:hypothetical protein